MPVVVAVIRIRKPVPAAAAPKSHCFFQSISPVPTIAAKNESPVIDSNWFWIANRSAMSDRRVNPKPWNARAMKSSTTPMVASVLRPVPKARMRATSENR